MIGCRADSKTGSTKLTEYKCNQDNVQVLLKSFRLIGHKVGFNPWTQNYELHTLISNNTDLIALSKLPNLAILCVSTTTAVSNTNVQRLVQLLLIVLISLG